MGKEKIFQVLKKYKFSGNTEEIREDLENAVMPSDEDIKNMIQMRTSVRDSFEIENLVKGFKILLIKSINEN